MVVRGSMNFRAQRKGEVARAYVEELPLQRVARGNEKEELPFHRVARGNEKEELPFQRAPQAIKCKAKDEEKKQIISLVSICPLISA